MSAGEAQYRAAVDAMRSGLGDLGVKIDEVVVVANAAAAIALPTIDRAPLRDAEHGAATAAPALGDPEVNLAWVRAGAFGSAVFSWAGVLLVVEEAAVSSSVITADVTTLTAVLAIQAGKFATLRGEIADNSVFTGGHWPRSTTENHSDATVTDGDAEWSFER